MKRPMTIADEVRNDIKEADKDLKPGGKLDFGPLVAVGAIILVIGMWLNEAIFQRFDVVMKTAIPLFVVSVVMYLKWNLKRHAWFWITMSVIAGIHVAMVLTIPWPDRWIPGVAITGFAVVDIYLVLWILAALRRLIDDDSPEGLGLRPQRPAREK